MPIKSFKQFLTEEQNPAVDGRMIDDDAALGPHLIQISQAHIVREAPPHAEYDDGWVEMATFKHCEFSAPNKLIH